MATQKYKISMGNPCSYGWENMTPEGKGRHCAQCNKTVVDFTRMSNAELITYLLTHKNVCGHFSKRQLHQPIIIHQPVNRKLFHWPSVAAMVVAGLFQVMPMQAQQTFQKPMMTQVESVDNKGLYQTEPQKTDGDSLTTIKMKVVDSKNKKPLAHAYVTISGIGSYTSDEKGYFSFSVNAVNLPSTIQVTASTGSYYLNTTIEVNKFKHKPFYQLELIYDEYYGTYDGGDVYIEKLD